MLTGLSIVIFDEITGSHSVNAAAQQALAAEDCNGSSCPVSLTAGFGANLP
jgi:hypothetical protein